MWIEGRDGARLRELREIGGVQATLTSRAVFYLFDAIDTLDKIHRQSLVPLTRAAIRIIESTRGVTASAMRAG